MRRQLIIAAVCGFTALAAAVPAEARINQRQNHQQQRIAKGISNGSLTPRETARLEHNQVKINRYEARSRADGGGLNRKERARIERLQDRASQNIFNQKHDAQTR